MFHIKLLAHELMADPLAGQALKLLTDRWGQTHFSSACTCMKGCVHPSKEVPALQESVREARGHQDNKLELWGDAPRYEYSTVPLMRADGLRPVSNPKAGSRGHALLLNDKQVRRKSVTFSPVL